MKYHRNKIVVVDIDGTIANIDHRLHYLKETEPNWKMFFEECDKDEPIQPIIDLVTLLFNRYQIVFCTGRNNMVREKTRNWLDKHLPNGIHYALIMREYADYRPDTEVKVEQLYKYLHKFPGRKVAYILEDRKSMVRKWIELGYICLQVTDGNF